MIRPKTLWLHQIRTFLNPQIPKPLNETPSIHSNKHLTPTSVFTRNISLSSQFQQEFQNCEENEYDEDYKSKLKKKLMQLEAELGRYEKYSSIETKQSLETFFTEAIGLSDVGKNQESEKGLKKLSSLFSSGDRRDKSRTECKKEDEVMEFKELSPDMTMFADYLHSKGYFVNANFLPNNKFDVSCFVNNYARDFLKFAAEEFAKDHREIYK